MYVYVCILNWPLPIGAFMDTYKQLVRQSQIVQSVMYSYDAVISSYIIPAIHSWFGRSASEKVVFYVDFCSF